VDGGLASQSFQERLQFRIWNRESGWRLSCCKFSQVTLHCSDLIEKPKWI